MDTYQKYYKTIVSDLVQGKFITIDELYNYPDIKNLIMNTDLGKNPQNIYLKDVFIGDLSHICDIDSETEVQNHRRYLDFVRVADFFKAIDNWCSPYNILITKRDLIIENESGAEIIQTVKKNGFTVPRHLLWLNMDAHHWQNNFKNTKFSDVYGMSACSYTDLKFELFISAITWNPKYEQYNFRPGTLVDKMVGGFKNGFSYQRDCSTFENNLILAAILCYKSMFKKFRYQNVKFWKLSSHVKQNHKKSAALKDINHSKFVRQLAAISNFLTYFAEPDKHAKKMNLGTLDFRSIPENKIAYQCFDYDGLGDDKFINHKSYRTSKFIPIIWSNDGYNEHLAGNVINIHPGDLTTAPNSGHDNFLASSVKDIKNCVKFLEHVFDRDFYYNIIKAGPHLYEICAEEFAPLNRNEYAVSMLPNLARIYLQHHNLNCKLYTNQPHQLVFDDPDKIKYDIAFSKCGAEYRTFDKNDNDTVMYTDNFKGCLKVTILNVFSMAGKQIWPVSDAQIKALKQLSAKNIKYNRPYRDFIENL